MRLVKLLLLLLLTMVLSPGLAAAQETTKLNVLTPLPRHTAWYPLIVGEALGYFADEGIAVELIPGGDLPATAFLENGQADLASLDASEVINARKQGFDFQVVYEVMHGAVEGIFALQDNEAATLADLAGTTIGIVGESDRGLLLAALSHAGLSESDVTIAVLGESAPLLANSLRTGQVSAVVGAVSDLVAIRSQGIDVKNLLPDEMRDQPANSYAVRADQIEAKKDLLQGFFRAWAKGAYAGQADQEVAAAMAKKAVPENWVDEEFGMVFLDTAVKLHTPSGELYGELRTPVWEKVQDELVAAGQLDAKIDTAEFLNPVFIEGANDFDLAEVDADLKAWRDANM